MTCSNALVIFLRTYNPVNQAVIEEILILVFGNTRLGMVVSLNEFLFSKEIWIDDAGWGDLILGVVVGALKMPDHKYMERRIPTQSFQPPYFENKRYLDDAVKIAEEIVYAMRPDEETRFNVCSGYVLSSIRRYLKNRGFTVEKVEITGELQNKVEKGFSDWCAEVGVPFEKLGGRRRFWTFLEWVAEKPDVREKLVKTGWKKWNTKWRDKVYKTKRFQQIPKMI